MTDQVTTHHPRLDKVQDRLDKAVSKLESLVSGGALPGGKAHVLSEEVESFRSENARLRDANATVSKRLGKTIDRLKAVLGE